MYDDVGVRLVHHSTVVEYSVYTGTATLLFVVYLQPEDVLVTQHVGNDKNGRLPTGRRLVANLCAGNRRGYFTNNYPGEGVFNEKIVLRVCIYNICNIYIE
jgi:hypothetical protein